MGWEVDHHDDLEAMATRLDAHGVRVRRGTAGARGPTPASPTDRLPPIPTGTASRSSTRQKIAERPVRSRPADFGFKTGPLGMGHVVLNVDNIEQAMLFYRDVLGFSADGLWLEALSAVFLPHQRAPSLLRDGRVRQAELPPFHG